jgi:hypothetical protein
MKDKVQNQILSAVFLALRPLAKILLRFGIGFREFSEIAKTAFVDVATTEYGLRGRPTNISRVAVMTGLTRKEVRRLREKIEQGDYSVVVKATPLSEILHRWHAESEYLDSSGTPAILDFSGNGATFSSLVKRYGGDIPPGAMRTELKRVGAIKELEDAKLKVINRTVHPAGSHEKLITALIHAIYPLAATVANNVNTDKSRESWAQMTAYSQSIRSSDLPRLRRISFDRLSEVATAFDDLFMAYESLHEKEATCSDNRTVAVGVFYFEEHDQEMADRW